MRVGSAHAEAHSAYSCQLSAESIAKDLQISCGLQICTTKACRELHGMGFHGQAAASKLYITKCNAKHRMHWTLEHCQVNATCLTTLCQV
ncbi:unnamed protein product [Staurois parvus]|uniref:Transposase Tc1-like domain-containing protein n=1 Tax=Staurois parvus TaxID=386267 RepID=A0ABN9AHQ3_9NEOB|nr:unnamed protein product [Staurois parvus]